MVEISKQGVEPLLEILNDWLKEYEGWVGPNSTIDFAECLKMQLLEAPPPKEEICCDNCLMAVTDAAYESGIDIYAVEEETGEYKYPDDYGKLLSRRIGADIPDHDCEQLDPEAARYFETRVCICDCHNPDFSIRGES